MNHKTLLKSSGWLSVLIITILWSACDPPIMSIDQPSFTEINSSFKTPIEIFRDNFNSLNNKEGTVMPSGFEVYLPQELIDHMQPENVQGGHVLYFGIMLPLGWAVSDSISFQGDMKGKFIYSDKRTQEMQKIDPARHGFYWWVGETIPPIPLSCERLRCFPEISTDNQTGDFHLDYMLGYYNGQPLLNTYRINNQYINIGSEDTVWVTSAEESGPGSIREAIHLVKTGGRVLFDLPRNTTINISKEIWIYKSVNIDNQDHDDLVITSENCCRLLHIEHNAEVYISGIRLERGKADQGGAVYCGDFTKVILRNMIICNNSADQGGGIFCGTGSVMNFANLTIRNNCATSGGGGGIYCGDKSKIELANCYIIENDASGPGGGICLSGASAKFDIVRRSNIFLNRAGYVANDLYSTEFQDVALDTFTVLYPTKFFAEPFENFHFNILHGKFEQINADVYVSPSGDNQNSGLNEDEPFETIHFAFSRLFADSLHPVTMHLLNGTYSPFNNQEIFPVELFDYVNISGESENGVILDAGYKSSVLQIAGTRGVTVSELTIRGGSEGGVRCIDSDPVFYHVTINSCSAIAGGGMFFERSNAELINVSITGNIANTTGGGIYCDSSNLFMEHVNISDNTAIDGGGIYFDSSNLFMEHVIISDNTANDGGGIYSHASYLEISNVSLSNNIAAFHGGGIYCSDDSELRNITVSNNQAFDGGAINCNYSDINISKTVINGNSAKFGGAVFLYFSNPIINDVVMSGNHADKQGGALYLYKSDLSMINVKVLENDAFSSGGGLYCNSSEPVLHNMLCSGNSTQGRGGGIYITGSHLQLTNVTLTNNFSNLQGGGFYSFRSSFTTITNSILWDNDPEEAFLSQGYNSNTLSISYSDVKGYSDGIVVNEGVLNWLEENIGNDPLFSGIRPDPYDILENSPCIDAGTPDTTGLNLPPFDLLGNNRILDGDGDGVAVVDMGAYEFVARTRLSTGQGGLEVAIEGLQVFPNPCHGLTSIKYTSQVTSYKSQVTYRVELTIFDLNGNKILTLVDKKQSNGEHTIQFNASTLPAGIYLVRLQAGGEVVTEKLVVMK